VQVSDHCRRPAGAARARDRVCSRPPQNTKKKPSTKTRYDDAERRFQEAVREAELGFPEGDAHVPCAVHNLADFYRATGRRAEARRLYRRALKGLEESFGTDAHWLVASAMISLGMLEQELGQHEEALRLLERALEVRAALFSRRSLPWADAAATLAKALRAADAASAPASRGGDARLASARRARAVELLQAAVSVVEDAGMVEGTPVLLWDLELAEALMERAAEEASAAGAAGDGASSPPSSSSSSKSTSKQLKKARETASAAASRLRAALSHFEQLKGDGSAVSGGGRVALDSPELAPPGSGGGGGGGAGSPSSSSSAPATAEERRMFGMTPEGGLPTQSGQQRQPAEAGGAGGGGAAAPPPPAATAATDGRVALLAAASEITERLADALAASGDLPAAVEALSRCADARVRLFGRHLVVGRTLARLSALHLRAAAAAGGGGGGSSTNLDPASVQLALHAASGGAKVAEEAWRASQDAKPASSGGSGGFLGRLAAGVFGGGGGSNNTKKSAADLAIERSRGSLEVGRACVALARAHEAAASVAVASGDLASAQEGEAAAVAALQRGAEALRAGQRRGADEAAALAAAEGEAARRLSAELERRAVPSAAAAMAAQRAGAAVDAATGVLVDIKLAQLELLDALVAALRAKGRADRAVVVAAAAHATNGGGGGGGGGWFSRGGGGDGKDGGGGASSNNHHHASEDSDDVKMLLVEAETIAGELYGSD
jgi:tetratricopeptide (TPR) repeat protein